jgi:predicted DNA-binding protein (MmcQ/YjbR family)
VAYPSAYEDNPWGERAIKVRGSGKVFVFMGRHDGRFSITTKLPVSGAAALSLPFAKPTGYGLGKSGWVSAGFASDDDVPEGLILEWIKESYVAVAPKKLSKSLDGGAAAPAKKAAKKKATKKKATKKKATKKKA